MDMTHRESDDRRAGRTATQFQAGSSARASCEVGPVIPADGGTVVFVASHASDQPGNPVIVVTNPGEDCSPEAFRHLLDELESGPEPELESLGAADVLRELRVDADG